MDDSTGNSTPQLPYVEQAKYFWEEYRYRHDLIWRLMFRMTAVAVLLSIAPFTIDDLAEEKVGGWVDALPAIALALVAISWLVLQFELSLFDSIDREYTQAQDNTVGHRVRDVPRILVWKVRADVFAWVVRAYPIVLFVVLVVVALVAWTRG
jgi:hypothetical protein